MNNMYISSVESANEVLNFLKSLKSLDDAQKKIGREAAMFLAKERHSQAVASAARLRDMEIKFYMRQGYTENEARKQILIDDFAHAEYIGLGTPHKCRFRKRKAC